MGYRVVITLRASDDLHRIRAYIAQRDQPTASRIIKELAHRISILENFPQSGRLVPELKDPCIRELVQGPYRIIYRIREKEKLIEVARYWHGARGIPLV